MKAVSKYIKKNLHWFVLLATALLCVIFMVVGTKNENGYITLDGKDAVIEEGTQEFIESSKEAFNRIMNEDKPTDEETIAANSDEATGQGFYVTIDDILNRRLAPGSSPYQCSRYTAYLATGKSVYSTAHIDYGPVNGKGVAAWLVNNYGFKYIDTPVKGAIGSGGFNTQYGHTALYLYPTGTNTAMVEDANYTPLAVSTHNMNISGWVWVVPGNYEPDSDTPTPDPQPSPVSSCNTINVVSGDTMGAIMRRCEGYVEYGETMNNYAKTWYSTIVKPGQSVYDGWVSGSGVGLFAGDTIERRK